MDTRTKIIGLDQLPVDDKVRFASGRFDILTAEHCRALADLAAKGEPVVALVEADRDGADCVLDERSRAHLVAALGAVSRVVICDRIEREGLLEAPNAASITDIEQQVQRNVVSDVLTRHDR